MLNPVSLLNNLVPKKYHQRLLQFIQFGIVGLSGLALDTSTVYLLRSTIGLTTATLIAYFIAATSNWFFNHLWTFRYLSSKNRLLSQWLRFITTNTLGFCLNRGTVFILFFLSDTCRAYPVIALFIGAMVGMLANFNLSRRLVYTTRLSKKNLLTHNKRN